MLAVVSYDGAWPLAGPIDSPPLSDSAFFTGGRSASSFNAGFFEVTPPLFELGAARLLPDAAACVELLLAPFDSLAPAVTTGPSMIGQLFTEPL